ncbi:ferroxidase fet3 [Coemansia guatemalensis]|uniref:Ferroxidase fet3 n=1 Tax=Coemansia guatemalensis TaxID=2761395 RepID=A0A9W8I0A3_9FUNG|nr:ferroxidase fet3 [Coemansia guatemalensis]
MNGIDERQAVAVNGKIPMPMAVASLGDVLVLRVRNALDERTGLHSHGLFNNGTNYYDGAGMVTECGIAPGSEMSYEIELKQTGTYWIHGHHNSQYINGLRGPLIITDPHGEPYDYDEDIVLTFEDWFPKYSTMVMGGTVPKEPDPSHRDIFNTSCIYGDTDISSSPDGKPKCKENGTAFFDPSTKYPFGVINGLDGEEAPDLNMKPNKTYRLRLLNIGSTSMFRFGIEGHKMHIIEVDGVNTEKRRVDSVLLGVAQRVSVLVEALPEATANFKYRFEMFTDVFPVVSGYNPRTYEGAVLYGEELADAPAKGIVWEDFDDLALIPLDHQQLLENPNVVHDVVVSADRTPTDMLEAYINKISFKLPTTPSLFTALSYNNAGLMNASVFGHDCNAKVVEHMDIVELRVQNTDSVYHPMHLHGHFFQIVERGVIGSPASARRSQKTPMRRDTILVGPNSYAILRLRADNPGVWLLHCHIERHMELGLSMMLVSAPDKIKERMAIPAKMKEQCRLLDTPV